MMPRVASLIWAFSLTKGMMEAQAAVAKPEQKKVARVASRSLGWRAAHPGAAGWRVWTTWGLLG